MQFNRLFFVRLKLKLALIKLKFFAHILGTTTPTRSGNIAGIAGIAQLGWNPKGRPPRVILQAQRWIIVGYQPEKIRRRRYEQKLNENDQYATQSR